MAVATKRSDAVELLMAYHPNIQMILADDGLQHHALYRDAEWIVVDAMRGFGNGKLFPQGFLREQLTRLEGATVIYHDRQSDYQSPDALRMALVPSAVRPLLGNVELDNPDGEIGDDTGGNTQTLKPQKVYAVTGIGHPTRFFDTLRGLDFDVIEVPFGDHHAFVIDDLTPLGDLPIITTSKDAVKLRELAHSLTSDKADTVHNPNQYSDVLFANIWELPVTAVLSQAVYAKLDQLLADFDISTDQNPSGA